MDKDIFKKGAEYNTPHKRKPLFEFKITADEYHDFMVDQGGQFTGGKFVITPSIGDFLNHSFDYFTGNIDGKYKTTKGIMIIGAIGNGKTTIMKMITELILVHGRKIVETVNCKNLVSLYKQFPPDFYFRRPMIFDDIGKDEPTANHYGTTIRPFEEIIAARYDQHPPRITFGTANYSINGLDYNESIKDRLREMFTVIKFEEGSFR